MALPIRLRRGGVMNIDLAKFHKSLPYASELYGIYQPLLGWRSRPRAQELSTAVGSLKRSYLQSLRAEVRPVYEFPSRRERVEGHPFEVHVGERVSERGSSGIEALDSIVARKVGELVASAGFDEGAWQRYTSVEALEEILNGSRDEIQAELEKVVATPRDGTLANVNVRQAVNSQTEPIAVLAAILRRESMVAGA